MRTQVNRRLPWLLAVAGSLAASTACQVVFPLNEVRDVCQFLDQAQIKDLSDQDQALVFEAPGTIAVYQGFGCARSERDGTQDVIRVRQELALPDYAGRATVFLSGWKVKYLHKDHHVTGLGTFIRNISVKGTDLGWEAVGTLGDHNFDDAYEWCYHYTVIAWNPAELDLVVDDEDAECAPGDSIDSAQANLFVSPDNSSSALSAFASFLENPGFAAGKSVAILPRGFGLIYAGDDPHLFQLGQHVEDGESYVEGGASYEKLLDRLVPLPEPAPPAAIASRVDPGFVTWETYAVIKDNSTRDYRFGELVTGLGGSDVGLVQPPFAMLPRNDGGFFGASLGPNVGLHQRDFVVENVPFEFAIPVLSSWELGYPDDDEHVTEAGIWIDSMAYDRAPGAPTGTLRYTIASVLRDKKGPPGHLSRQRVTILGIRPLSPGVAEIARKADLVPFSPSGGRGPAAFCRLEEQGKLLRVTVRNQGEADAGPSRTTVSFRGGDSTVNTPAIPSGGSADLLFKVPNGCFDPDCAFRIRVDSAHQVDEGSGEGNNSASGSCPG